MNGFKKWYLRTFCSIDNFTINELKLEHVENIYGDYINHIGCRSIWKDDKGRTYRGKYLH